MTVPSVPVWCVHYPALTFNHGRLRHWKTNPRPPPFLRQRQRNQWRRPLLNLQKTSREKWWKIVAQNPTHMRRILNKTDTCTDEIRLLLSKFGVSLDWVRDQDPIIEYIVYSDLLLLGFPYYRTLLKKKKQEIGYQVNKEVFMYSFLFCVSFVWNDQINNLNDILYIFKLAFDSAALCIGKGDEMFLFAFVYTNKKGSSPLTQLVEESMGYLYISTVRGWKKHFRSVLYWIWWT